MPLQPLIQRLTSLTPLELPPPLGNPAKRRVRRPDRRAFGVRVTRRGVLFTQPLGRASVIAVAGDFNGWDPALHRLELVPGTRCVSRSLSLEPGRYAYRLVVDGQWCEDPYNPWLQANPYHGFDNLFELTAPGDGDTKGQG